MLVTGCHYDVTDMDGYTEGAWRPAAAAAAAPQQQAQQQQQQVEPVDLSSSAVLSQVSGYAEPLDLSTSRRPHPPGYILDPYYSHQEYYDTTTTDLSQCRRWIGPDGYPCYDSHVTSGDAGSARCWDTWSPAYGVTLGDNSSSDSLRSYDRTAEFPDKHGVHFGSYHDRPSCAFYRKQPAACPYRQPPSGYTGYPVGIGAERNVYRTNGGLCKYMTSRTQSPVTPTRRRFTPSPPPATTTSGDGAQFQHKSCDNMSAHEGVSVFVSNSKHFAGGLVISRKDDNDSTAEPLPPLSIPDFVLNEDRTPLKSAAQSRTSPNAAGNGRTIASKTENSRTHSSEADQSPVGPKIGEQRQTDAETRGGSVTPE